MADTNPYTHDFFAQRHLRTVESAEAILSIVLDSIPSVRSAVDVGCGVGSWLEVLQSKGVHDVCGMDGPWVDKQLLRISLEKFVTSDLSKPIDVHRRYDLACSLEVAEHLAPEHASHFVASLTSLSDFVLFSAAIPYQGGRGHLNEQWPAYWSRLFSGFGYFSYDIIRPKIWSDDRIPYWYRQNILLYVADHRRRDVTCASAVGEHEALALVHPEAYLGKVLGSQSVRGSARSLGASLVRWFTSRIKPNQ